jgi:catechol 2,3-dioxygenase-like lactoylglutathione lyase family enzyme
MEVPCAMKTSGRTRIAQSAMSRTLVHEKERRMFSHVMVGANDVAAAKKFYDAVLGAIGIPPGVIDEKGRIFYRSPTGVFAVTKPINGAPATAGNGGTIGFAVSDPARVDAWHAAGVANGGMTCEDLPGVREGGMGKMYLAYLRDPSGNKLCALHRMASKG